MLGLIERVGVHYDVSSKHRPLSCRSLLIEFSLAWALATITKLFWGYDYPTTRRGGIMAVEENVNWRLTRPIHDLVDGVRNRLSMSKSPSSGVAERSSEYESRKTERKTEWGTGQLVSPRERVLKLLAQNEGGMNQSEIVSAVDWSESTVSRKLGKLEADDEIVRYRIGRGKCVYLPGEEPDVFKSQADLEDEERRLTA